MADVMAYGGDGGANPPHPPSGVVPRRCQQSAQSTNKLSVFKSLNLEDAFVKTGCKRLPIEFDTGYKTQMPVGDNQNMYTRLIGNTVRITVPPFYVQWKDVPDEENTRIRNEVLRYFDVESGQTKDELDSVWKGIKRISADCYHDYKRECHEHYELKGPDTPYRGISNQDWQKIVELFESPEFKARSATNKENRANVKYPSLQGSRSFAATRYAEKKRDTEEFPSLIDTYVRFHGQKNREWVNAATEAGMEKLVQVKQTQLTQAATNNESVDEHAILKEVFGTHRGHARGVGRILKGTSQVQVCLETGESSNSMASKDDLIAAHEAEIRSLKRTLDRVLKYLPAAILDEDDEEGVEDEALGDM